MSINGQALFSLVLPPTPSSPTHPSFILLSLSLWFLHHFKCSFYTKLHNRQRGDILETAACNQALCNQSKISLIFSTQSDVLQPSCYLPLINQSQPPGSSKPNQFTIFFLNIHLQCNPSLSPSFTQSPLSPFIAPHSLFWVSTFSYHSVRV